MSNHIIDPQIFYWMNVFESLQFVLAIIGSIFVIAFLGLIFGWIYNQGNITAGYKESVRYATLCKRWAIVSGLCGFIMIAASIFIPGKTTSVEMLVAKTATIDNVNWTVQQVKDVVDYIVQAIKRI